LLVVIAIIAILAAILFPVFAQARERARQASCLSNMKQIGAALMQYNQDNDEGFPEYLLGATGGNPDDNIVAGNMDSPTIPAERYHTDIWKWAGYHYKGWMDAIHPYAKSMQVYQCPAQTRPLKLDTPFLQSFYAGSPTPTPQDDNWRLWPPSYGYNLLIAGGATYPGAPSPLRPAKLSMMPKASNIYVLLHGASVYQKEPYYHIWESSQGMANDATGARPHVTGKEWRRSTQPHNDGSVVLYADGHAKWHSLRSKEHGQADSCTTPDTNASTGCYNSQHASTEYLNHWIPTAE
jgi:prepilin-type processing-associated H-X9-DG protein